MYQGYMQGIEQAANLKESTILKWTISWASDYDIPNMNAI